ncbi:tetraacyldisaccharide 4'-kinase [Rhodobacteraceae bacterium NNCM2]|nr:tetraacyldisaccharide 4'-kinase [Coraliihabitans acroporae]
MQAPAFWFARPGVLSALLSPLSWVWRLGTAWRHWRARPEKMSVPVICIGNLTAGGAGKTPMAEAWLMRLQGAGHAVHLVSRGYGGSTAGPHRVDPAKDTADLVGDEPLLLAQLAPVWVSRDRAAGARAAIAAGATLILLDDGFQNPSLVKDASVLMVDAGQGFGNRHVLPAGPLREPVAPGLARADLVVLVGAEAAQKAARARWPELDSAIAATLAPMATGLDLAGQRVVAFAGIGRPEKFFETLRSLGAELVAAHGFPDHHVYAPRVLDRILREARGSGSLVVTTEKDAVKLPPAWRREVMALPVRLTPADWAPFDELVAKIVTE